MSRLSATLLVAASTAYAATNYNVDFSSGNGGWIAATDTPGAGWVYDEIGYWRVIHADYVTTTLTSPTALNLGSSFNVTLWHSFSSEEGYDYGQVQYSTNAVDWNLLEFANYVDTYESARGFTGNYSQQSLGQYYSETSVVAAASGPVYLRFLFVADETGDGGMNYLQWSISGIPVPEPSTYGLMLGGLALAGAAVRRRMRKQAA